MSGASTWLVEIDMTPRSRAVAAFARWLRARDRDHHVRLVGVHVIESGWLRRPELGGRFERHVRKRLDEELSRLHARRAFDDLRVLRARFAEDALGRVAAEEAAGLVVARARRWAAWLPWRLGRTSRRLLRRLPGPIAVVPADWRRPPSSSGPLLVALAHDDSSRAAFELGDRLRRDLRLPIRSVRVDPDGAEARAARTHAVADAVDIHAHGRPVHAILGAAREQDACMIVCGARGLGLGHRLLVPSISTALATRAAHPVLVVPPPDVAAAPPS